MIWAQVRREQTRATSVDEAQRRSAAEKLATAEQVAPLARLARYGAVRSTITIAAKKLSRKSRRSPAAPTLGCPPPPGLPEATEDVGLRRNASVQNFRMFRLRNLALLWLGRKVWAVARPAVQRRLRHRKGDS